MMDSFFEGKQIVRKSFVRSVGRIIDDLSRENEARVERRKAVIKLLQIQMALCTDE